LVKIGIVTYFLGNFGFVEKKNNHRSGKITAGTRNEMWEMKVKYKNLLKHPNEVLICCSRAEGI